jgi:hypothetical protein
MYHISHLAPLHAADKETAHKNLDRIYFDAEKTEATDGIILVRVSKAEKEPDITPRTYAAKNFDKRAVPIKGMDSFSLENIYNSQEYESADDYPKTDAIMPTDWTPDAYIDIQKLEQMIKALKQYYKNSRSVNLVGIKLPCKTNRDPLQFIAEDEERGTFKGLIMPVRK